MEVEAIVLLCGVAEAGTGEVVFVREHSGFRRVVE